MYATITYDFETGSWVATAAWDPLLYGIGDTPQEAVESLRYQCSKHDLWPKS